MPEVLGFDIRENRLIYILEKNKKSHLIKFDLLQDAGKIIGDAPDGFLYYNPKFLDDARVVFLECARDSPLKTTIYVSDTSGNNIKSLWVVDGYISDFALYADRHGMILSMASEVKQYSPIVAARPHRYNLYSLDFSTQKLELINNSNSYHLNHISFIDSNRILFEIQGDNNGIMSYNLRTRKSVSVNPINNPRGDSTLYYAPAFLKGKNQYFFSAPYQIYIMDSDRNEAKIIYTSNSSNIKLLKTIKKNFLAFTKEYEPYIYTLDIENHNIDTINFDKRQ